MDTYSIVSQLTKEGAEVLYLREAVYPALQVEATLLEKSRDEIGSLEISILRLLKNNVSHITDISFLIGIKKEKLNRYLSELDGKGLIKVSNDAFLSLTKTGELTIQYGNIVVSVTRSFYICGITGRFLPDQFYRYEPVEFEDLRDRIYYNKDFIYNNEKITFDYDIYKIENRKSVNIPDEVIKIESINDNTFPVFFPGIFMLYRDKDKKNIDYVKFFINNNSNGVLSWLDRDSTPFIITPLGYSENMDKENAIKKIMDYLINFGATLPARNGYKFDNFENPVIYIDEASDALYSQKVLGKSIISYIGSDRYKPVPITKLFVEFYNKSGNLQKKDLLDGRPLKLIALGKKLIEDVNLIRAYYEIESEFLIKTKKDKGNYSNKDKYIENKFIELNLSFDRIRFLFSLEQKQY
jgi:predicted transcriptional regulator